MGPSPLAGAGLATSTAPGGRVPPRGSTPDSDKSQHYGYGKSQNGGGERPSWPRRRLDDLLYRYQVAEGRPLSSVSLVAPRRSVEAARTTVARAR